MITVQQPIDKWNWDYTDSSLWQRSYSVFLLYLSVVPYLLVPIFVFPLSLSPISFNLTVQRFSLFVSFLFLFCSMCFAYLHISLLCLCACLSISLLSSLFLSFSLSLDVFFLPTIVSLSVSLLPPFCFYLAPFLFSLFYSCCLCISLSTGLLKRLFIYTGVHIDRNKCISDYLCNNYAFIYLSFR